VVQLSSGGHQSCALKSDGTVVCWGYQAGPPIPDGLNLLAEEAIAFTSTPPSPAKVGYLYSVAATGDLGKVVTIRSETPATCVTKGDIVVFVSPGPCSLVATQEWKVGDRPARPATQTFDVFERQWVTFTSQPPKPARVGSQYAVTVTGGRSGNPVTISSLSPNVCSVLNGRVNLLATGMCKIAATQAGNSLYLAAGENRQYFAVEPPDPNAMFHLAPNGVTVKCESAAVGSTGVVNGVEFTRRSRDELYALVAARSYDVLPTTCTSGITDMHGLFDRAFEFNEPIGAWDVSDVTNMRDMFRLARYFNQPIGAWDVSAVTNMSGMFALNSAFNQPIGGWDVSAVTDMSLMFSAARRFDQPIGSWNVSAVTNMSGMFMSADVFNQPIGAWDVSAVTNMNSLFMEALFFNQPIGAWDVSAVTTMREMFVSAYAFNQSIDSWDVSAVTNMMGMFVWAGFNQPIGSWDVSAVTTMQRMFASAENFNQPIGDWDVSAVTNMSGMFGQAMVFNQPIGAWDVSAVTDMSAMFSLTDAFNQPIDAWDVSSVRNMTGMFQRATAFNQDLSHLCVPQLPSIPASFDSGAIAWTTARPVWGTCPD